MIRRQGLTGIATLLLAVFAGGVRAQELELKEADIHKLIPLLRAEAAGMSAGQAYVERQEAARTGFSGDPLEFFSGRAKVSLPQGARYVAGCSRAASAGGPVAIFTFGWGIDCYARAFRDWARTQKRGPDEKSQELKIPQECHPERERTKKFLDGVQSGLEKSGCTVYSAGDTSRDLISRDENFELALYAHNIYDRANPLDTHPLFLRIQNEAAREAAFAACSDMPSGPILVIRPGNRFFEKEPLGALDIALRKAGLSEKDYQALKEALLLARMDTQPEWFQAAEAAAGNDPAALRALSIRRGNANLYHKLAAELGPLLDALVPRQ